MFCKSLIVFCHCLHCDINYVSKMDTHHLHFQVAQMMPIKTDSLQQQYPLLQGIKTFKIVAFFPGFITYVWILQWYMTNIDSSKCDRKIAWSFDLFKKNVGIHLQFGKATNRHQNLAAITFGISLVIVLTVDTRRCVKSIISQ